MKHLFVFLITVLVMMSCSVTKEKKTEPFTKGEFKEWAQTPPMGWNSWDCYGPTVEEKEVKANTDYMAEKLKEYGWQYIVVDIRWYVENDKAGGYNQKILVMYLMNTGATNQPSTVFHRLLMEQDLRHWQTIYITKV